MSKNEVSDEPLKMQKPSKPFGFKSKIDMFDGSMFPIILFLCGWYRCTVLRCQNPWKLQFSLIGILTMLALEMYLSLTFTVRVFAQMRIEYSGCKFIMTSLIRNVLFLSVIFTKAQSCSSLHLLNVL